MATAYTRDQLIGLYWTYHPRFRFFKNLVADCRLLDLGAGSGRLVHWKTWSYPRREDISMYAIDVRKGELYNAYNHYQICDIDEDTIDYPDCFFDAILASHVIEHISRVDHVFAELHRILNHSGQLYIETPAPETLNYPDSQHFKAEGLNVTITNFYEDETHVWNHALSDLRQVVAQHGLSVLESGVIRNEFLEEHLMSYGTAAGDEEITTMALWSQLRWSHYVVAEKPEQMASTDDRRTDLWS